MKEFDPVEEVIEAVRGGKIVVVMDDEDRENEGEMCIRDSGFGKAGQRG